MIEQVYLSQILDSSVSLGLISEEDIDLVFKLNILFFEKISVSGAALLGNRQMYSYLQKNNEAISTLYKGTGIGGSGILCPVISGGATSMQQIARNMIYHKTVHQLPNKNNSNHETLIEHAELIDDLKPELLYVDEIEYRNRFEANLEAITPHLLSLPIESICKYNLSRDSLRGLDQWLTRRPPGHQIRSSDIWRLADELKLADQNGLKALSETVYSFSIASAVNTEFSAPELVTPIVDMCREFSEEPHGRAEYQIIEEYRNDIEVAIPLREILRCSLEDVMFLRDLETFRKFRTSLAKLRGGEKFSELKVRRMLDDCSKEMDCYLHKNEKLRTLERFQHRSDLSSLIMRISYTGAGATIPSAMINLISSSYSHKITLATFLVSGAISAGSSMFKPDRLSKNCITPTHKDKFYPIDGTVIKNTIT